MSTAFPTLVLLFVIAAGAVGAFVFWAGARQKQLMQSVAASAGLQVDVTTKRPPPLGFDLFDRGSGKRVSAQMWRAGEHDSVFRYQYTEGSGDNSTTHRHSAALVRLPFTAPHLTIAGENWWSRMKRIVGSRDIEVESPAFNDRYHVRCPDERFAITLLDPPMIAWMLSPSSGSGTITFEFGGEWMLCHCRQVPIEDMPQLLAWAKSVLVQLPVVLTDLYGR